MLAAAAVAAAVQSVLPNLFGCPEQDASGLSVAASSGLKCRRGATKGTKCHTSYYICSSSLDLPSSTGPQEYLYMQSLFQRLHEITQIDADCLRECYRQIVIRMRNYLGGQDSSNFAVADDTEDPVSVTPTDVQDVIF